MRSLLIPLPVLACPLLMGACMFFMSRGTREHDETTEVAALRQEVEWLRTEIERSPSEQERRSTTTEADVDVH